MITSTIIPLALLGMVVFVGCNMAFGLVQIGPILGRFLLGAAVVCGGIAAVALIVGGNVQTALVLP